MEIYLRSLTRGYVKREAFLIEVCFQAARGHDFYRHAECHDISVETKSRPGYRNLISDTVLVLESTETATVFAQQELKLRGIILSTLRKSSPLVRFSPAAGQLKKCLKNHEHLRDEHFAPLHVTLPNISPLRGEAKREATAPGVNK